MRRFWWFLCHGVGLAPLVLLVTSAAVAASDRGPMPGSALETFTLPGPSANGGMWFPDLQDSFPGVDWQTLDRLYIPAAHYRNVRLGNLPLRSAARPLVITNIGGQVRIGGLGFSSYNFVIEGGSYWQLTGRYDASAATGDAAFPGHDAGYGQSRDRYGFLLDDAFEDAGNSGIGIGGGATNFDVAYLEIRHVGFAGMLVKTDNDGDAHMENVSIHDNYIHDTGSEGVYFGSTQALPQHKISGLRFFNNRIVRVGTEALQLGQLGGGSEIYNNVFLHGAIGWKRPFGPFQDNNTQIGAREGDLSIHHNVFIGGASKFFILFDQTAPGDVHAADHVVRFENNYFSHSRSFGMYFHSMSDGLSRFRFADNVFREIQFHYDELNPTATDFNTVFRIFNTQNPIEIVNNRWSGSQPLVQSAGTNVTSSGNVNEATEPLRFAASGFPAGFDHFRLELWADETLDGAPIVYHLGDFVMFDRVLYENVETVSHTGKRPDLHPATWQPRNLPVDDLRLAAGSAYTGIGLLDALDVVFADGFEAGDLSAWSP